MKKMFICIVAFAFFAIILYNPHWQAIDDHSLLDSLTHNRYLTLFVSQGMFSIGRFTPLSMQEFNALLAMTGKVTPRMMHLLVGLQFLIFIFLLQNLFQKTIKNIKYKSYMNLFLVFLVFSPGFVTAFLRLFVPERSVLFFFLLFLYFFIRYQENQKLFYAVAGLLSANLALYYKEPVFLMLGVFAFSHLLFNWRRMNAKQKGFDALLIASSVAFVFAYYLIVYSKMTGGRYGVSDLTASNLVFLRSIVNMTLNDPLLLLVSATAFYRLFDFYRNRTREPLYDSMLLASLAYVSSFFILGIHISPHYLIPAYVPGIIALGYFLFKQNYKARKGMRFAVVLTALIFFTNTMPATLHTVSYYKNTTTNFQETLDFFEGYVKAQDHRVRIFLDGVNRGSGVEVYHSFIKYLNFRGLSEETFDLLSDEEPNSAILFSPRSDSPYTVHQSSAPFEHLVGDVLLISPYSLRGASPGYKKELSRDYELLFRTTSFLPIPLFTTKEAIRWLLMKYDNPLMTHVSGRTMDYYVFKKIR